MRFDSPIYAVDRAKDIERTLHRAYLRARRMYGPSIDPNQALTLDPTYEGLVIEWKVLREKLWAAGRVSVLTTDEAVAARIENRKPVWTSLPD
jgi:hypothetical protein